MEKQVLFNCSETKAFSIISKFWEKNKDQFPLYYQKYFNANIFEIIDNNSAENVDDITMSIFNYLELLDFNADKESQFLSFFEQFLGFSKLYGKNIVSITYDCLPTLSKKIISEEKKATIRTYGPNILFTDNSQMILIKKAFSQSDIEEDDELVISFVPRENAELIIKTVLSLQKELLLNFDGFVPQKDFFFKKDLDTYIKEVYDIVLKNKSDSFDADVINYSQDGERALVLRKK